MGWRSVAQKMFLWIKAVSWNMESSLRVTCLIFNIQALKTVMSQGKVVLEFILQPVVENRRGSQNTMFFGFGF